MTADTPALIPGISGITLEEEMQRSYLDYAMSVIVSRALPDVRDGLKPVHRRILYAMKEGGYDSSKSYKKSARIVGDVMGKYHPHGDSAIYDSLVRMAQDFSMRQVLIDGQGNFGSMDGDAAAAMRYTEARLHKAAETLLEDIDQDTVDFQPNYDESTQEPVVLPARFPNLLVNGASGIAVGMATNIPTHNLGEVIDACCALIDDPELDVEALMNHISGPDFPTGGIILGRAGIRAAMHTGRGSIAMRGRTEVEEIRKDRQAVIITEIPYQVNKLRLIERIAECVHEKIIEGISDLRDESDRDGVRIVVELKRDAMADVVLNQLYRHTPLQTSFGVNALALNNGRPVLMNIKQMLVAFIAFREQVITRRTEFDLRAARARGHVLAGLAVAVVNIDPIIALIKAASDQAAAKEALMAKAWPAVSVMPLIALVDDVPSDQATYTLSEIQAKAILDLRLHRLTGLERDKIAEELQQTVERIQEDLNILGSQPRRMQIMKSELLDIRENFATPRRTSIEDVEFEVDVEDLIQREDMVVTFSHAGYVKRVPLATYRAQKRGGKGRAGMSTKDEDFVTDIFVANTHTAILFFSSAGKVYQLKVWRLPLGNPQARGKALVNLLPLENGETITAHMALPDDATHIQALSAIFVTSEGNVRRNRMEDFSSIRPSGLIAMKLEGNEKLIAVAPASDEQDILLCTSQGKAIRFPVSEIRVFAGRASTGVRGIKLAKDDKVISLSILQSGDATAEERAAFLKIASDMRRSEGDEDAAVMDDDSDGTPTIDLPEGRVRTMAAQEEFILTVGERGLGKRSSSYDYRVTGRGGSGVWAMDVGDKTGPMVAAFPVREKDEIMLVTDGGQVIRMPVQDIRIAGRRTRGVMLFRIDGQERVVSVAHLTESDVADSLS